MIPTKKGVKTMRKVMPKDIYVMEKPDRCADCRFLEDEGVYYHCFLNYAFPWELDEAVEKGTVCSGCGLRLVSGE